jgi:ribosomal protein S25
MTNREFLTAVITANISDEMNAKANALIAGLDKRNEQRKGKPSKTAVANEPVKKAIVEYLQGKGTLTASAVGEGMGISTQKASALCRQLVEDGVLKGGEVKIKGKGSLKAYSVE